MEENPLTFSELRKIQKTEKRQDDLSNLDDNFLLRVSSYLGNKKNADQREYRSAKRVFDKIIGLRQEKIVRKARIAVKSEIKSSELELLPREKELYLNLKKTFQQTLDDIESAIEEGQPAEIDTDFEEELEEELEDEESEEESEESETQAEDGYEIVKIVSNVPEFMGTDLESYGPFEEGEEVEIPDDNAEILINRGSAESLD